MKSLRVYLSFCVFGVVIKTAAVAGVVYELETKSYGPSGESTMSSEVLVEGSNLKMAIAGSKAGSMNEVNGDMIFHGQRREVVGVDHGEKAFFIMNAEMIEGMAARMGQMRNQFAMNPEMLKRLPPEAREALKNAQAKGMNIPGMPSPAGADDSMRPKPEFNKTSDQATMHGYPCVKYEMLVGGEKKKELWVTDWDNVAGGDEVATVFEDMAAFFQEMMDAFGNSMGGGPGGPLMGGEDNMFAALKSIGGFPVVTREFENGELESESFLRSANERDLDPADFEPPAGYKLRTMGPR